MEQEWIASLRSRTGSELLGDDAAVLGKTIVTVDMLTEGVDFLLDRVDPRRIGRKALAVNLSDIAAMGGVPESFLVSFAMPNDRGISLAERLYEGMQPLIDKYHLTLAGGDTNTWSGGLVVSITMLGRVTEHGVLRRGNGKPGDAVFVTGPLGGSILDKQFSFEPRVFEALHLNGRYDLHAAMDISDGLSLDLDRLATESRCGVLLVEPEIPISEDAVVLSRQTGRTALEHALSDGEDFELLLTASENEAEKMIAEQPLEKDFGVVLYRIGTLTVEPGMRIVGGDGAVRPLEPRGFLHAVSNNGDERPL